MTFLFPPCKIFLVLMVPFWADLSETYKTFLKREASLIRVAHMLLNAIKHLKVWNYNICLNRAFYSQTETINQEVSCKAFFQISCLVNKYHFFIPVKSILLLIHLACETKDD